MRTLLDWTLEHQGQLVPLIFAFPAVYFLLPGHHRILRSLGVGLGLLGLAGLLGLTIQPPGVSLHGVLFYVFAATAILSAVSTVAQRNPIYSALSFALVTLSVCGLFLLRGAQFLASAMIIIYAGAVVVTFLFIIMLARQSGNAGYDRRSREPFLATLASFVLLGGLLMTIDDWMLTRVADPPGRPFVGRLHSSETSGGGARMSTGFIPVPPGLNPHPHSNVVAGETSRLRGLGRTLFSDYLIIVELAGTLLLVAGVGAVAVAPRRTTGSSSRT